MNEQEKEAIAKIRESRLSSNAAILQRNAAGVAQYWMDDMVVISGEGGQYIGKAALLKVFKEMFRSDPPIFERIPAEIRIAESGELAWESGTWNYKTAPLHGNYAAMWRKINGRWLTQSELFVSLD